ncbi:MAG: hypothetical protein NZ557_05005, partial [Chthonomonadaceae bacterium]|nr:hypothetical protein [Chthonomonadaceae bacterium]
MAVSLMEWRRTLQRSLVLSGATCFLALCAGARVGAQQLPERMVPAEVERASAPHEIVEGTFAGVLFSLRVDPPAVDGKYRQPYRAACLVYPAQSAGGVVTAYARRFAVYVPDADALPVARRVARMLLLLYGLSRERMRFDHARDAPTVQVWLTRGPGQGLDPGIAGEQFRNQIYLYDLYAERRGVEWIRQIAHEYGHYALPGVSGFAEPEEWGNGMLGERLYVKWLVEALQEGHVKADAVPFATPEEVRAYAGGQVVPLIERIARDGVHVRQLTRRDAEGMRAFAGLALYVDAVYGSEMLRMGFAYASSGRNDAFLTAVDFLRGVEAALGAANDLILRPPLQETTGRRQIFYVYLPRG